MSSLEDLAKALAWTGFSANKKPCAVEVSSLELPGYFWIRGHSFLGKEIAFGPYQKGVFNNPSGEEGLARIVLVHATDENTIKLFEGDIPGTVSYEPRGNTGI